MDIIKKELSLVDNFVPEEFFEREGSISVAAFSVEFNSATGTTYRGVVGNTIISSSELWRTFRNEDNEDDYDFCLTFYYDGTKWTFHLSGIIPKLEDISLYVRDILIEFGISEDQITYFLDLDEDYDDTIL